MDVLQVLAISIHTVAFVIAWGYYGVLGRMVLPGLKQSLDGPGQDAALAAIERQALPLVLLSLVLFTATGTYLLVIDVQYAGLANYFASTWTTLMLIKHLLVIGLIGMGVMVDRLVRQVGEATDEDGRRAVLHRLDLATEGATGLGALIVLLTAAAQAAA
jgi:uncharacterized membrane protein